MTEPCACAATRQAARTITNLYDSHLRKAGMESPQFALLRHLEHPRIATDLARALALDKTTLSRNLKLLEKHGWIEAHPGTDKRQKIYSLTPLGRKQLAIAKPLWKKAQSQLRSTMTNTQWTALFRALQSIT